MTHTPINFTVESLSPGFIKVAWEDDTSLFSFRAKIDGDQVTEIATNGSKRVPTIVQRAKNPIGRGPSAGMSYHDAYGPEFGEITRDIMGRIASGGAATAARAQAEQERRKRDARIVASKAKIMRDAIADLTDGPEADDAAMAEAYDRIQNSVW